MKVTRGFRKTALFKGYNYGTPISGLYTSMVHRFCDARGGLSKWVRQLIAVARYSFGDCTHYEDRWTTQYSQIGAFGARLDKKYSSWMSSAMSFDRALSTYATLIHLSQ